jgi:hypothetical protein
VDQSPPAGDSTQTIIVHRTSLPKVGQRFNMVADPPEGRGRTETQIRIEPQGLFRATAITEGPAPEFGRVWYVVHTLEDDLEDDDDEVEDHRICYRCRHQFDSHGAAMFTPCGVEGCRCAEFVMPLIQNDSGVTTD